MDNKEKWEEFVVSNNAKICLYAKPWWLDLMTKIGGGVLGCISLREK